MSHVAKLRERFKAKKPLKSPMQFELDKRKATVKEVEAIQIARQRAAAYNMTLRALAIQAGMRSQRNEKEDRKAREEARKRAQRFRMSIGALPLKKDSPEEKEIRAVHHMLSNLAVGVLNESNVPTEDDQLSTIVEKSARSSLASKATIKLSKEEEEEVAREAERQLNRKALVSFLQENAPERISEVDELLDAFKGREDVLFEELTKKLNEELAAQEQRKREIEKLELERQIQVGTETEKFIAQQKKDQIDQESKQPEVEALEDAEAEVQHRKDSEKRRSSSSLKRLSLTVKNAVRKSSEPKEDDAKEAVPSKGLLDTGVELRQVIESFYQVYAPEKVADVDAVLKHFAGRERDLFATLEIKYNVTFSPDGAARPNNTLAPTSTEKIPETEPIVEEDDQPVKGETRASAGAIHRASLPFVEAQPVVTSKFAVDVQSRVLGDRLRAKGNSPEKVKAVMDSSGPMM